MSDELNNLLSNFGLPPETEEQVVRRKRQQLELERQERFNARMEGLQRGGASESTLMGSALAERLKGRRTRAQLDAQAMQTPEAKMARLGDAIRNRHDALLKDERYKALPINEKQHQFLRIAAEEADRMGLPSVAQRAAAQYVKSVRDDAKADIELRKAGVDLAKSENDLVESDLKLDALPDKLTDEAKKRKVELSKSYYDLPRIRANSVAHGYLADGTPVSGMVQADGSLSNGNQTVPVGQWYNKPPPDSNDPESINRALEQYSPSHKEQYRGTIRNAITMTRYMDEVLGLVENAYQQSDDGSVTFLGNAGAITKFLSSLNTDVKNVTKAFGRAFTAIWDDEGTGRTDPRGMSVADRSAYVEETLGGVDDVGQIMRDLNWAHSREQFDSLIVQMAYAQARLQEPGNERLSDTDFRNAMQAIGGAIRNPETMRTVFAANARRHRESSMLVPAGIPPNLHKHIFHNLLDIYNKEYTGFKEKWGEAVFDPRLSRPGLTGRTRRASGMMADLLQQNQ